MIAAKAIVHQGPFAVILGGALLGCAPKPTSVTITCQSTCLEGSSIQFAADVRDAKGQRLPFPVAWSVEPNSAGKLEGARLLCLSEGKLSIRATTSGISSVHEVNVASPLVGTWQRQNDHYAGLKIRISSDNESHFAGYIVGPPDDSALPAIKSERKIDDARAGAILACAAHVWSPGLKKWSGIRRLGEKRWSVTDLNKEFSIGRASCREDESKSQYEEGYELSLADANKLELRNLRINQAPQSWQRIPDVDEAAIAAQKAACERARSTAAEAYAEVVPALDENAKQVSTKFWAGNGSLGNFKVTQRLVAKLKEAQAGLTQGAYRARQAARAVPTTAAPEVKKACDLSEAMFEACKDLAP